MRSTISCEYFDGRPRPRSGCAFGFAAGLRLAAAGFGFDSFFVGMYTLYH